MNMPEYDKLAKELLLDDKAGIEEFIGKYIQDNVGSLKSYELIIKIADLLNDLSEIIPNITRVI